MRVTRYRATVRSGSVEDNCTVASLTNDYNATSSLANDYSQWEARQWYGQVQTIVATNRLVHLRVVVFEDNENPVFVNCPDTITVGNNFGLLGRCELESADRDRQLRSSSRTDDGPAPGGFLPVGEYEVSYEAIDSAGNTAECAFIVEVVDTQEPVLGCPQDVTVDTDEDVCEWTSQPGSLTPIVELENCGPELQWSVENPDGT